MPSDHALRDWIHDKLHRRDSVSLIYARPIDREPNQKLQYDPGTESDQVLELTNTYHRDAVLLETEAYHDKTYFREGREDWKRLEKLPIYAPNLPAKQLRACRDALTVRRTVRDLCEEESFNLERIRPIDALCDDARAWLTYSHKESAFQNASSGLFVPIALATSCMLLFLSYTLLFDIQFDGLYDFLLLGLSMLIFIVVLGIR